MAGKNTVPLWSWKLFLYLVAYPWHKTLCLRNHRCIILHQLSELAIWFGNGHVGSQHQQPLGNQGSRLVTTIPDNAVYYKVFPIGQQYSKGSMKLVDGGDSRRVVVKFYGDNPMFSSGLIWVGDNNRLTFVHLLIMNHRPLHANVTSLDWRHGLNKVHIN